jgi:hypothetical protein
MALIALDQVVSPCTVHCADICFKRLPSNLKPLQYIDHVYISRYAKFDIEVSGAVLVAAPVFKV